MRFLMPVLSGLLFYLSFHPVNLGPLAWIALAPMMVYALSESKGWRSFLLCWLGGAAWAVPGMMWVRHTAPFGPLGIGIYVGFYVALGMWAIRRLCLKVGWPLPLAAPVAWIALEFLRNYVWGGFPLMLAGYTQHEIFPLIQVADIGGPWLVSGVVIFINAIVARAFREPEGQRRWAVAGVGVIAFCFIYGIVRVGTMTLENGPTYGIVQPNIPQDMKNISHEDDELQKRIFQRHLDLTKHLVTEQPDVDVVLWPESVIFQALFFDREKKQFVTDRSIWKNGYSMIALPARTVGKPVVIGSQVYDIFPGDRNLADRAEYSNSAVLFSPEGDVLGRYDKNHLVHFAEYLPFQSVLPVRKIIKWMTNLDYPVEFRHGGQGFPTFEAGRARFGISICGEVFYPEISREIARKGAPVLVNISNDGWFQDSAELDLMLVMSRFRAIENRVLYIRATNTGISAFIEPTGRIQAKLTAPDGRVKQIEGTLAASVRIGTGGSVYRTLGDWLAWLCAGLAVAGLGISLFPARNIDSTRVGA